jgi:isoquinoline 1-oxidoreductase subunit beta
MESFVDEIAHEINQDPIALRRQLIGNNERFARVLETVIAMASWVKDPWLADDGRRHAMGIALSKAIRGTYVGQIAEVSIDESGQPCLHKIWQAVDCGFVVNPLNLVMQVESGVATGWSSALQEQLHISNGQALQSNLHDYAILTAQQMPEVEVELIKSDRRPIGVGEMSNPLVAPAVCNALFNLTGQRIRSLPITAHKLI